MCTRSWWRSLSFFWKTFISLVFLTFLVVGLAEGVLEPLAEGALLSVSGGFQPWHEGIMWGVSIILPSLLCGYIFSRRLSAKMQAMASAADRLSRGNFASRLPVVAGSKDVFDQLAGSFNNMAQSLETLVVNERRLLTDISHELRSPLGRMGIALELLPLKQDPVIRQELLERLEKEVHQMGEMVGTLLYQGKERISAINGKEEPVDISTLLLEVIEDITFHGQRGGKSVTSTIHPDMTIMGNAPRLRLALMNVGMNALFYTSPGKPIFFYLVRGDSCACITIRDYGPGVPESDLENIFRAFYRADDSRDRTTGGVGLGLALAREAVLLQGGSIYARNANPGLEVTIRFPLASLHRSKKTAGGIPELDAPEK